MASKRPRNDATASMEGKVARARVDSGLSEAPEAVAVASGAGASAEVPKLATHCLDFVDMRSKGFPVVDKTGAIADLLNYGEGDAHRIFFARPRKFGKTFTLSTAAEILAAGALPAGVEAWPAFESVDVDTVFSGMEVHARLKTDAEGLCGLLQQAHFVVLISLGGVPTGTDMKQAIIAIIANIAYHAFRDPVRAAVVRAEPTPEGALRALIKTIPDQVPVAVLIDGEATA